MGIAKETVFGTPVAATSFVPVSGVTMQADPGLFYPPVMMGQRDTNIFPLYNQFKFSGGVDGPLFPTNGIPLLQGAIGNDAAASHGVTGTSATTNTTQTGGTSAGAATTTFTSAVGFAIGDIVQIDVNASTTTAEVRKISGLAGAVATWDVPLTYAHLTLAPLLKVIAPFTHTFTQGNSLPSLTIEKNVGGYQSEQYAGCRVNKFSIKCPSGNNPVTFTADLMGQSYAVMGTPTVGTYTNESPWVFAESSLTLFGTLRSEYSSVQFDIENGVKDTYTGSGQHGPSYLTPVTRKISGSMALVFSSLNDATYGYFTDLMTGVSGSMSFVIAHPPSGLGAGVGSLTVALNKCRFAKLTDDLKFTDVVMQNIGFEAELDLSASPANNITITLVNSAYLPY